MQHIYVTHQPGDCDPDSNCYICDGGLAPCKICGGAEGSLTTECPGHQVHSQLLDAVYAGIIDFIDGQWVDGPKLKTKRRAA